MLRRKKYPSQAQNECVRQGNPKYNGHTTLFDSLYAVRRSNNVIVTIIWLLYLIEKYRQTQRKIV